jgi:hypothetical protein
MKLNKADLLYILVFIILFIAIRTLYYFNFFQFIYDQVASSTVALEIWKSKKLMLIGPPASFTVGNRLIFFGGAGYYIQLIFLLIGRFDPFWSTYAFMVTSAFMIPFLYSGTKSLINRQAAIVMCLIYSLLPFFIEATVTLWNPYFLIMLLPLFLFLIARFNKKQNKLLSLLIGIFLGILFQLHYHFITVIIGLLIYYFSYKKLPVIYLLIAFVGFCLGFSNMILFELRHQWYTLKTLTLFFTHPNEVSHHIADYYFTGAIFFGIVGILYILRKKLTNVVNIILFALLMCVALYHVTIKARVPHYPPNWYYKDDLKAYSIIKENYYSKNIRDFNVFEFYSAVAATQKYYMKRDDLVINYDDYRHNKYLYVIFKDDTYMKDAAYEVNEFRPSVVIQTWKINPYYNLYLLQRVTPKT